MNLNKLEQIEDYIVKILQEGPITGPELVKGVSLLRNRATKQAVYKTLRKLKGSEVVVVHGGMVSLSSFWINKMTDFLATARHNYSISSIGGDGFLDLQDGDKITYSFKNPETADIFWGHAFDILSSVAPQNEPVYVYNPHEWFILARQEQELFILRKIAGDKRQILVTCSGGTMLDKYVQRFFIGSYMQYYLIPKTPFKRDNYYLNIFGEYMIEAFIDEGTHAKLDKFYENCKEFNDETKKEIQKIVSMQGHNKISISRNSKKADKFKKILKKNFYIIPK